VPGFLFLQRSSVTVRKALHILVLALFATMSVPAACWAQNIAGKVVGVADGDTITVLDCDRVQHKIRLAGIDAPEKKQPFGQRSKQFLSDLVFGKLVEVETEKRDQYRRQIGKVYVDGRDANLVMVAACLAWHYKESASEQSASDRLLYASAEDDARQMRRGLWGEPNATPPWDWRASRRSN
jgi:endonuclease YncB( thermonuclease family)